MDRALKDRPQNGPGANSIRGGLRSYATKTTVGNWLEDVGGPQGFRPGFTTEDFLSESHRQQLGARKLPIYGNGLPSVESVLNPPQPSDLFQPVTGPGAKTWESSNQTMLNTVTRASIQAVRIKLSFFHKFE